MTCKDCGTIPCDVHRDFVTSPHGRYDVPTFPTTRYDSVQHVSCYKCGGSLKVSLDNGKTGVRATCACAGQRIKDLESEVMSLRKDLTVMMASWPGKTTPDVEDI